MNNLREELIEFMKFRSKINTSNLLDSILSFDNINTLVEYLDHNTLSIFTTSDDVNVIVMLDWKYIPLLEFLIDPNKKYLVITEMSTIFRIRLNKYTNITHVSISLLDGNCISSTSLNFDELDVIDHDGYEYEILNEKIDDKYDELSILDYNKTDILCTIGSPRFKLTFKKKVITPITNNSTAIDDELVPYGINQALKLYLNTGSILPIKYKKFKDLSKEELAELAGVWELEGLTIQKLRFFWQCGNIGLEKLAYFMGIASDKLGKMKSTSIKLPLNIHIESLGTTRFVFTTSTEYTKLIEYVEYIDKVVNDVTNITFVTIATVNNNNTQLSAVIENLKELYSSRYKFKLININLPNYIKYKNRIDLHSNMLNFNFNNILDVSRISISNEHILSIASIDNEEELLKCNPINIKVDGFSSDNTDVKFIRFIHYNGHKTCGIALKLERRDKNGEI